MARDLLTDSGTIFVQIGDENVHRVRAVIDEVFGVDNFVAQVYFKTASNLGGSFIGGSGDFLVWYARSKPNAKYRQLFQPSGLEQDIGNRFTRVQTDDFVRRPMSAPERSRDQSALAKVKAYRHDNLKSQSGSETTGFDYLYEGHLFRRGRGYWKTNVQGMDRLAKSWRLGYPTPNSLSYVRFIDDFSVTPMTDLWVDTQTGAFTDDKTYVVQTNTKVIERCILMCTDPGDLVLDPTCGSGTTAYVAEQWGRRWIIIDTSRVALALARARVMGAPYSYYLLADISEGLTKEAEITHRAMSEKPTYLNIRQGFVYERVPHITLRDIANNAEIDVIYEEYQEKLEPLRAQFNQAFNSKYEEWEMPREAGDPWPEGADVAWHRLCDGSDDDEKAELLRILNRELGQEYTLNDLPEQPCDPWEPAATEFHEKWWKLRIDRQKEIDASIAAKAEFEYLYDKPYEDRRRVRVAGPFTVESITPHRVLCVDENGDVIDGIAENKNGYGAGYDFAEVILENLRRSGVQQAHKEDRISFSSLAPWPGRLVCAEGRYAEGPVDDEGEVTGEEKRTAIFIGPEFGTVSRPDLVEAAREAADARFDVLIACAFNYDAHTTEFERLGRIPVLKARMNADLHMAGELKNTGNGNLFVIFGEPDIDILDAEDGQLQVKVNGVDVYHPNSGEVRSDGPEGIACWFIDTDYDQESFFVRRAYFLGASDPYRSLKTTLKAEIDADAWESLHSDTSRPFPKPEAGRIAVKVINHLGDEVMKVFRVE